MKIGEKAEDIIITKAGLVDDENLRKNFFPKFTTHTTLFRLIYKGKIKGQSERFEKDLFPKGIELEVERRIIELNDRLAEINK